MEPLTISERAMEELTINREKMDVPVDYFVRIGIRGSGHSVDSYLIGFDQKRKNDQLLRVEGLEIIVDQEHTMYILGMEIDFIRDVKQEGFVFRSPNKK